MAANAQRSTGSRLVLAPWPAAFERDLAGIGLAETDSAARRPRALLYAWLRDMEIEQKIDPDAEQIGRLGSHWLFRRKWPLKGYGLPTVWVWFTIRDGRITAVLAYAEGLDVTRRGQQTLAIERTRAIHDIADVALSETA